MTNNTKIVHQNNVEPWKVTLVDTGLDSMTGGRLKRIKDYVKSEKEFCFTYGDGVADVNITDLIEFHRFHGKLATLTSVRPPARYGALKISDNGMVGDFQEKPISRQYPAISSFGSSLSSSSTGECSTERVNGPVNVLPISTL